MDFGADSLDVYPVLSQVLSEQAEGLGEVAVDDISHEGDGLPESRVADAQAVGHEVTEGQAESHSCQWIPAVRFEVFDGGGRGCVNVESSLGRAQGCTSWVWIYVSVSCLRRGSDGGKPVQTQFSPFGFSACQEGCGGKSRVSPGFPLLWQCTVAKVRLVGPGFPLLWLLVRGFLIGASFFGSLR